QAEDGIRDLIVTGVQTCALPIFDGETVFTLRHECRLEVVLGRGGRWELSGRDWASWNAAFGPHGPDGLPVPLWDGSTGAINKSRSEERRVGKGWRARGAAEQGT